MAAFAELGITIRWDGKSVNEKRYDAEHELGWKRKVDFKGLVSMMMDADLKEIVGISCDEYKGKSRYR